MPELSDVNTPDTRSTANRFLLTQAVLSLEVILLISDPDHFKVHTHEHLIAQK